MKQKELTSRRAGEEEEKCSLNARRTYVPHATSHLSGVLSPFLRGVREVGERKEEGKVLGEAVAAEDEPSSGPERGLHGCLSGFSLTSHSSSALCSRKPSWISPLL